MEYIDLHIHTEYTQGHAITKIPTLVKRAKEYGMNSLSITDSGNIKGFEEFISECNKFDIKPILGCGFYFAPLGMQLKETEHLVLIARDIDGYKNLLKLVSYSQTNGLSSKPRIDFHILSKHNTGLICLTGGLGGVFDKPFINGNNNLALDNIKRLKEIFKSDLYLELQDNGQELNRLIKPVIMDVAKELDIEVIVTGGSFYLDNKDSEVCNRLRDKNGNKRLSGSGYNFKSPSEILNSFNDDLIAVKNSVKVANSIIKYDI